MTHYRKRTLLGPVGQGGESVDLLLGDVLGKALEAGRHVPLSDVDVVALGHPRRAAAHQSRQAEFVHPAFRGENGSVPQRLGGLSHLAPSAALFGDLLPKATFPEKPRGLNDFGRLDGLVFLL